MRVGDTDFSIIFDPYVVSVQDAARQFCAEKGVAFGVTAETMTRGCIEPVQKLLKESLEKAALV